LPQGNAGKRFFSFGGRPSEEVPRFPPFRSFSSVRRVSDGNEVFTPWSTRLTRIISAVSPPGNRPVTRESWTSTLFPLFGCLFPFLVSMKELHPSTYPFPGQEKKLSLSRGPTGSYQVSPKPGSISAENGLFPLLLNPGCSVFHLGSVRALLPCLGQGQAPLDHPPGWFL